MSLGYADQSEECPSGVLSKAHAVTSFGGNSYCYDQNGNMEERNIGEDTYTLSYDAENRLVGITGAVTATFVFDGDGNRVQVK